MDRHMDFNCRVAPVSGPHQVNGHELSLMPTIIMRATSGWGPRAEAPVR